LDGELENRCGSVVVSCCWEKLVAEAGDSSGTHGRWENVSRWKPLPSNGSEDVTVETSMCLCVTVNCITRCIKESNKSDYQSKPRPWSLNTTIFTEGFFFRKVAYTKNEVPRFVGLADNTVFNGKL
jgi:hypothetical protein